jgi:pre-mRNA-processing factor 19
VTCAHSLEPHGASPCTALALHATERYGVTAAGDGSFALLDLAAGAVVARGQCPAGEAISAAALHPDGLILATGVDSGAIRLWDLKSMSNAATFEGKADAGALAQPIRALAFSENGYQLASAAEDGTVKVRARRARAPQSEPCHRASACRSRSPPIPRSASRVACCARHQLWDLRKLAQVATIAAHESVGAVASLRFDESAQFLAVGGAAGVAAYSSKSWDLLCAHATASAVSTVRFAPNARALLALTGKEIVACAPGAA